MSSVRTNHAAPQRLKTAVDRTIANEQARSIEAQRSAAATSSQRPGQRSRASSGATTHSPARKPRPTKKSVDEGASRDANGEGATVNLDPAIFEAAFVIDDTDEAPTPARTATPNPADKQAMNKDAENADKASDAAAGGKQSTDSRENGDKGGTPKGSIDQPSRTSSPSTSSIAELPLEIKARLRKLDKLEKTYPGAYSPMQLHSTSHRMYGCLLIPFCRALAVLPYRSRSSLVD